MTLVATILIALISGTAFAHEGCGKPSLNFDPIQLLLNAKMESAKCIRLNEGESAVLDSTPQYSLTGVEQAYRLQRTGRSSYKSEVRLSLKAAKGENISDGDLARKKQSIQDCLTFVGPALKGPAGESLQISLSDDPEVPLSEIEITKHRTRENSHKYSLKSNCAVVLHEILHLHGLVDEYKEETTGVRFNQKTMTFEYEKDSASGADLAYTCRHVGPEDSPMRNHWKAFVDAMDWEVWEFNTCSDKENPNSFAGGGCPAGTHANSHRVMQQPGTEFKPLKKDVDDDSQLSTKPPQIIKHIPATRKSALEPAHFLAITRPGCMEENKIYYTCAVNAYSSEVKVDFSVMPMGLGSYLDSLPNPTTHPDGEIQPPSINMGGGYSLGGMMPFEDFKNLPNDPKFSAPQKTVCSSTPAICRDPNAWVSGANAKK